MKMKMLTCTLFASVVLVACNGESGNKENSSIKNNTEDIKGMVHDYSESKSEDKSASITSRQLKVTDYDEKEHIYELPEDEFFVSIAPFINETHPCENHSLTGCQGELANERFNVYIEDLEGNVVIDETMASMSNGFLDLWLPRDQTYQIKIEYEGKMVESEFSTFENDNTCNTTMQLI